MTRIYLAVGHGIKSDGTYDPGASGGKWTEQKAGDIIVAEAARALTALGATVRSEAYTNDPNYTGTIRAANAWPADIAVEVHHDWSGAPDGAFGHWYRADSKALADRIQTVVGMAGFRLRPSWHKRRTDLSFIKSTHMPSVLYEVGRIGTSTLDTPAELQAMGQAIAQGIANYLGLRQLVSKSEPKPKEVDTVNIPVDNVIGPAGHVAHQTLRSAGLLSTVHPLEEATGNGLTFTLDARLLGLIEVLEARIEALEKPLG